MLQEEIIVRANKLVLKGLGLGILILGATVISAAEEIDSEAVIKYRQGVMKAQGGLMAAMAQIVRGKVQYDARLPAYAQALQGIIGDIPDMFPADSDFGETDAKAEIWEDSEEFRKASEKAENAATSFQKAVDTGDKKAIGRQFKELAEACKGCHKKFRKEENE